MAFYNLQKAMIGMFVSHQKFFAVPLVIYEHEYEVSSLYRYDIGKLGFQNPCACFWRDSRAKVAIELLELEIKLNFNCGNLQTFRAMQGVN